MTNTKDLRDRRLAAGLSQEALARLADCSTGYVRLLESGYTPHSGSVAERVAAVLEKRETGR